MRLALAHLIASPRREFPSVTRNIPINPYIVSNFKAQQLCHNNPVYPKQYFQRDRRAPSPKLVHDHRDIAPPLNETIFLLPQPHDHNAISPHQSPLPKIKVLRLCRRNPVETTSAVTHAQPIISDPFWDTPATTKAAQSISIFTPHPPLLHHKSLERIRRPQVANNGGRT